MKTESKTTAEQQTASETVDRGIQGYGQLVATAKTFLENGNAPLTLTCEIKEDGSMQTSATDTQGENLMMMPGETSIIEAVVTVENLLGPPSKAHVKFSNWKLNGTTINLQKAIQTPAKSTVPTNGGTTTKKGGEDGLPSSSIMAAWVGEPGVYTISTTGEATLKGKVYPFSIAATVTLLPAPISAKQATILGKIGIYDHYIPNTSVGQIMGFNINKAPAVGFEWEADTADNPLGTVGFVQFIRNRDYTKVEDYTTLRQGPDLYDASILDSDGTSIFYPNASSNISRAKVKLNDAPYVPMASYAQVDKKTVFYMDYKCYELKRTYLAYQSLNSPGVVASFVVGQCYQDWSWANEAARRNLNSPFEQYGYPRADMETFKSTTKWMPLEWTSYIGEAQFQTWNKES